MHLEIYTIYYRREEIAFLFSSATCRFSMYFGFWLGRIDGVTGYEMSTNLCLPTMIHRLFSYIIFNKLKTNLFEQNNRLDRRVVFYDSIQWLSCIGHLHAASCAFSYVHYPSYSNDRR